MDNRTLCCNSHYKTPADTLCRINYHFVTQQVYNIRFDNFEKTNVVIYEILEYKRLPLKNTSYISIEATIRLTPFYKVV